MRAIQLAPLLLVPLLLAAGPAPEMVWRQGIADQNKFYAQVPHAMLKIQDSIYLGDGQSAVLEGRYTPSLPIMDFERLMQRMKG